jgi:hypothetical protein
MILRLLVGSDEAMSEEEIDQDYRCWGPELLIFECGDHLRYGQELLVSYTKEPWYVRIHLEPIDLAVIRLGLLVTRIRSLG